MNINIDEIILNKIKELDENKIIEEAINKRVESMITEAVNNAFSWDFSRTISEKIKEQVGDIASRIQLNSYSELVAHTVKNILDAELNKELAEKVQTKVKELLLVTDSKIKFSEIVKTFRDVNFEDDEEYSYEVTRSESYDGNFTRLKFSFIPCDSDNESEKLEISFSKYCDDDYTISYVKYGEETRWSFENISMLRHYDRFECLILKCMLNSIHIEIDWDESQCEDQLYQSLED